MNKTRKYIVTFLVLSVIISGSIVQASLTDLGNASWKNTVKAFIRIPCMTCEQIAYGKNIIKGLDYNSQRIFRKMCLLNDASFSLSQQAWNELIRQHLSFEQMLTFEEWVDLQGATMELTIQALPQIKKLNYEAGKSFRAYITLSSVKAQLALSSIPLLANLPDANNQAVQGFFSVEDMTATEALDGLGFIAGLTVKQAKACEAMTRIKDMDRKTIIDALPLIKQLREDDAWNARSLYNQQQMTKVDAWNWLVSYFATPPPVQEAQFYRQDAVGRKNLLQAFYDGGEELIWKINNLHAITDRFGFEISSDQLKRMSNKDLYARFKKLSRQTQHTFGKRFYPAYRAGNHGLLIGLLHQATARDRRQVAQDLTSANIYALLSQGSELYDSSFRDILVPILKKRLKQNHRDNLLNFLQAIDPDNLLVSNFIVSLAQKGKLTTFFPQDAKEQKQILQLVAASAFKDEDTILLFSATFKHLLTVLEPEARSFLISTMVTEADKGNSTFSRLITVILQYYHQEYPQLLGTRDKVLITRAIIRHGQVDLNQYLHTPFAEWKKDGRLGSVSVFHPDDDGQKSFISNARTLLTHHYQLQLAEQYTLSLLSPSLRRHASAVIRKARRNPAIGLPVLFRDMLRKKYAVAFVKQINNIVIRHAAYVYAGEKEQQQFLTRFLKGGDEMFAQRGHSYWRAEQITDPLISLKHDRIITDRHLTNKQRFFSLGSCGGVKAYTRLTRMFLGHVDILATIGTGMAVINNPYNRNFFEVVAKNPSTITWKDVAEKSSFIFAHGRGADYLQPGSLTAILHKMIDQEQGTEQAPNGKEE